jgi:hypothetical protein
MQPLVSFKKYFNIADENVGEIETKEMRRRI